MSLALRCDMCGKIEGKSSKKGDNEVTTFNRHPLAIKLKNYKGHTYNVYANLVIEHSQDTETMRGFMENEQSVVEEIFKKAIKAGAINPMDGQLKPTADGGMALVTKKTVDPFEIIYHSLKNPEPNICDKCKRIMMKYCQAYGNPGEPTEF